MTGVPKQVLWLGIILCWATTSEAILPLRDQWREACKALSNGQATQSLQHFHEFENWYGEEPEAKDPAFREGWIRLWGLAALEAGHLEEAARLLECWLAENPDQIAYRAFIRFQLVGIYQSLGQSEQAGMHRDTFLEAYPELPECALIRWSCADAAIRRADYAEATRQLQAVIESGVLPDSGIWLAKAALALVELAYGNESRALSLLQGTEGKNIRLLKFWRALAAPSLVQKLMASALPEKALQAAAWFDAPDELIGEVAAILNRLKRQTGYSGSGAIRQNIWHSHWQGQLDRLHWSISRQAEENGLLASLYVLRLRALLEAQQPGLAGFLGEAILKSPGSSSPSMRSAAYKAIIESSIALKNWGRAEAFAAEFLEKHPGDPALPEILFLNARTSAARKEWKRALQQVEKLLEAFAAHRSAGSWKMLRADWLLQSGDPESALRAYGFIEETCPPSWKALIQFQKGRCKEALNDMPAAAKLYRLVGNHTKAPANLQEFASISLMKLFLKRMARQAFQETLDDYRDDWPDGIHRLMAENIAGMFYQRLGEIELAVSTYKKVVSQPGPESEFAREQLSLLYRETGDNELLRRHAVSWIETAIATSSNTSPTPFTDCRIYQEKTREIALPDTLLLSILDSLRNGSSGIPVSPCLDLLGQLWPRYRERVAPQMEGFLQWVESLARDAKKAENGPAFAAFQLHAAHLLESEGRRDSADTLRIEVLQAVGKLVLGEETDFTLLQVADKYDFPEAEDLLARFISNYPGSMDYPAATLRLARRVRLSGEIEKAREMLGNILNDWPDAMIFNEASLLFAKWALEDDLPMEAGICATSLLNRSGLSAESTAGALLIRGRADFLTGQINRGFMNCLRILTLYPDIHDKVQSAKELLAGQLSSLPEGDQRQEIELKMQKALQPAELHISQSHET